VLRARAVKLGDVLAPLGALLALGLAIFELLAPAGWHVARVSPGALLVIAALLGVRYAARRQAQKRAEILKAVPNRPLGLETPPGETGLDR
jgi:hypothetical protein